MIRERLSPTPEDIGQGPEQQEFERRRVTSALENLRGEPAILNVRVSTKDGEVMHTNFWDLDKTVLFAEPIHFAAVEQIYPDFAKDEASREELHKVYFDGFALGTSCREWDRMRRIYEEGQIQYKDALLYEREFLDDPEKRLIIDKPGHPEGLHEKANETLQRYGKIAYGIMEAWYNEDPEGFQRKFLKPEMIQLLKAKTRLGQANVYMTANQRDFARGLVKFSGVADYGLALASDEDMSGGGKEIAVEYLIRQLAGMGLKVNRKRASAIGDSIKGDVGSGAKAGLGSGVFVAGSSQDVRSVADRALNEDPDGKRIREILEGTDVEAIPTKEVSKSNRGVFRFGKRSNKKK